MEMIKKFLVENYGLVGIILMGLTVAIVYMAQYIVKIHKQERNDWKEERKEFRESLDRNSDAITQNVSVVKELSTILKTINKV